MKAKVVLDQVLKKRVRNCTEMCMTYEYGFSLAQLPLFIVRWSSISESSSIIGIRKNSGVLLTNWIVSKFISKLYAYCDYSFIRNSVHQLNGILMKKHWAIGVISCCVTEAFFRTMLVDNRFSATLVLSDPELGMLTTVFPLASNFWTPPSNGPCLLVSEIFKITMGWFACCVALVFSDQLSIVCWRDCLMKSFLI